MTATSTPARWRPAMRLTCRAWPKVSTLPFTIGFPALRSTRSSTTARGSVADARARSATSSSRLAGDPETIGAFNPPGSCGSFAVLGAPHHLHQFVKPPHCEAVRVGYRPLAVDKHRGHAHGPGAEDIGPVVVAHMPGVGGVHAKPAEGGLE